MTISQYHPLIFKLTNTSISLKILCWSGYNTRFAKQSLKLSYNIHYTPQNKSAELNTYGQVSYSESPTDYRDNNIKFVLQVALEEKT